MIKTEALEFFPDGTLEKVHLTLTIQPDAWNVACTLQLRVEEKDHETANAEMIKLIHETMNQIASAKILFGYIP